MTCHAVTGRTGRGYATRRCVWAGPASAEELGRRRGAQFVLETFRDVRLLALGSILAKTAAMSKAIPSVSKFMSPTPHTVERGTSLAKASAMMSEQGIRHLPVVDGDKLLGIITERDVRFAQSFDIVDPEKVSVFGAMAEELYTVGPETPLDEVVSTMAQKRLGSAVVVQDKRVVGILTTVDVCRAFAEHLAAGQAS